MGSPSSTTTAFRALVMLVCLVGIPLVAILGTSLPEMIEAVLAGQQGERSSSDSSGELAEESPGFLPTGSPSVSLNSPARLGQNADGTYARPISSPPPGERSVAHTSRRSSLDTVA